MLRQRISFLNRLVIFIGRDFERAGNHTIAAAHTNRCIVNHCTGFSFGKCPHETCGGTCRLKTMVALEFGVQRAFFTYGIIIAVDNRV